MAYSSNFSMIFHNFFLSSSLAKERPLYATRRYPSNGEITWLDIPQAVRPGLLQSRSSATVARTFSNSPMCFLKDWVLSVVLLPHLLQMPFPWVVLLDLHSSSSHHQAFRCEFLAIRRNYSQPNQSWGLINLCHHVSSVLFHEQDTQNLSNML